jgi:hypothetical protein
MIAEIWKQLSLKVKLLEREAFWAGLPHKIKYCVRDGAQIRRHSRRWEDFSPRSIVNSFASIKTSIITRGKEHGADHLAIKDDGDCVPRDAVGLPSRDLDQHGTEFALDEYGSALTCSPIPSIDAARFGGHGRSGGTGRDKTCTAGTSLHTKR